MEVWIYCIKVGLTVAYNGTCAGLGTVLSCTVVQAHTASLLVYCNNHTTEREDHRAQRNQGKTADYAACKIHPPLGRYFTSYKGGINNPHHFAALALFSELVFQGIEKEIESRTQNNCEPWSPLSSLLYSRALEEDKPARREAHWKQLQTLSSGKMPRPSWGARVI